MEWLGLSAGLEALLALGTASMVVALYLLRPRRRRVRVPFVALWREVAANTRSERLLSKRVHLWSVLLALLIALALVAAIGDPRFGDGNSKHPVLILVDTSASMAARTGKGTRLDEAKAAARKILRGLDPGTPALVASVSATVVPETPLSDEHALLFAAIDDLRVDGPAVSLDRATSFARARLDGVDGGRAFFITDGVNVDLRTTTALTAIPVGGAGSRENVAVTALGARRHPLDPSRLEAMVTLWNSGTRPRKVALTLVGDGRVVDTASMQLSPGERTTRVLPNLVAERELEARIEATDGIQDTLRADDIAYASVPRRRPIRVLAVTHGNLYLEAALLLDGTIELETASPADIPSTAAFDAVIFDRVSPPAPSTTPALYIVSPEETTGANFPLSPQGEVPRPRFDRTLRDHPLLAWLRLGDVNVARAALLKPDAADTVVAGDARGALLVTGTRNGAPFVTLAFDVRESDLPLRVAWPVLMLNAVDYLTERTVEELPTVHTGERVRVPASTGEATAEWTTPSGTRHAVPVIEGAAEFVPTEAGFHRIGASQGERSVGVNVDWESESGAPAPRNATAAGAEVASTAPSWPTRPWPWLTGFALLLCLVEWWTHHRRLTV